MHYLDFLNAKPLYYDAIDYDRMPRVWASIKPQIKHAPIIHLIGTNGKGTTGRFVAEGLRAAGKHVGHYTSPHILRFNERIWINGADATDDALQQAYERVCFWLDDDKVQALSYFEFTTLMAMAAFETCDVIVMEAGLGGEYDATAVFDKELTLVTPIGYDHQAFLGDTIEAIASTKLRAMANTVILASQPFQATYSVAEKVAREKNARVYRVESLIDASMQQCAGQVAQRSHLPVYLKDNLLMAMSALKHLNVAYSLESFGAPMFGRLSKIASNIWLDVGHNELAAQAIASALHDRQMVLVYNTLGDKAYQKILQILKPLIAEVQIIDIDHERMEPLQRIQSSLNLLEIKHSRFERIDPDKEYLVFGSFVVAEAFLQRK